MKKSIEKQIEKIYESVFKKVYSKNIVAQLSSSQSRKLIKQTVLRLEESKAYNKFAIKFAKELAKKGLSKHRGIWKKYFRLAHQRRYIAYPKTYTEFQQQQFENAIMHNFKMIKSIPAQVLAVSEQHYIQTLKSQVLEGAIGRKTFETELRKRGATNAKVIARTETAKLQTAIMENRARDLGSVAYFWLASNDIRTRQSHKDMNGVIVFWRNSTAEKPSLDNMNGNAGEFPNCRCSAEPILDERDITKATYKVYDYRTHKLIQLTKKQIIDCLKDRELK